MSDPKTSDVPVISACIGKTFDIHLQSMSGSTGYDWYLSGLPEGVALLGETSTPVYPGQGIGPIRKTFTFLGLKEAKGALEFTLVAPWKPTEPADQKTYALTVTKAQQDELETEMGASKFFASNTSIDMPPCIPYGSPNIPVYPLYGYPAKDSGVLSGYSGISVIQSESNCVLKYGVPGGIADAPNCTLKYGFPVNTGQNLEEIFAAGNLNAASEYEIQKADDEANCTVKYGIPGGISTNPENCTLKYGFPVAKK
ncbi:MAG: hypothetical protein CENE_00986 [Candidatus Celerinatantimonas neptuna]|nr:MAG: hypothetical protein CENE_00986 [Candidatus Celerinatantimonas neptuna]